MVKHWKKIAIVGFGREGRSSLQYFLRTPAYQESEITILSEKADAEAARLASDRVRYLSGDDAFSNLTDYDCIVRSPGVPYLRPEIQRALEAGVEVTSNTRIFFDELKGARTKIIGITGTKGKGTVATLIFQMLRNADMRAVLVGNIGAAALDQLEEAQQCQFVVFELSSFQLQDITESPHVAVVLDITPDHLDAHKNMKEYISAKLSIAAFLEHHDKLFFFAGNGEIKDVVKQTEAQIFPVDVKKFDLFTPGDMQVPGEHTFKNAVMAASVAKELGVLDEAILKGVRGFFGLEHRLQMVREVQTKDGVIRFYDDSASTNPDSAAAAVLSFSCPIFYIGGGKDKGYSYKPLLKAIKKSSVEAVILFGENRKKIERDLRSCRRSVRIEPDLEHAVHVAYKGALDLLRHGEKEVVIVLSPGAASFDMFKNAYARGDQFIDVVKNLSF